MDGLHVLKGDPDLWIGELIGKGGFGDVYVCGSRNAPRCFAVKVADRTRSRLVLEREAKMLCHLGGGTGIPVVERYGEDEGLSFIIMELLGPSLKSLFIRCKRTFDVETVIEVSKQLLSILEYVHGKGVVHRDVKPPNVLVGVGDRANQVYLVDFGLSYQKQNVHVRERINFQRSRVTGNARFCSINVHLGVEQAPRDDLEAMGYMMVYLLRGHLPWQGIKPDPEGAFESLMCWNMPLEHTDDIRKEMLHDNISKAKEKISADVLCEGLPAQFATYIAYCRALTFEQRPSYDDMRSLLDGVCYSGEPAQQRRKLIFNFKDDSEASAEASMHACSINNAVVGPETWPETKGEVPRLSARQSDPVEIPRTLPRFMLTPLCSTAPSFGICEQVESESPKPCNFIPSEHENKNHMETRCTSRWELRTICRPDAPVFSAIPIYVACEQVESEAPKPCNFIPSEHKNKNQMQTCKNQMQTRCTSRWGELPYADHMSI